MLQALTIIQIISDIALILLIIMQSQGAGLSGAFGGEGMFYRSKRGVEKFLYRGTVVVAAIIAITSLLLLVIGKR